LAISPFHAPYTGSGVVASIALLLYAAIVLPSSSFRITLTLAPDGHACRSVWRSCQRADLRRVKEECVRVGRWALRWKPRASRLAGDPRFEHLDI